MNIILDINLFCFFLLLFFFQKKNFQHILKYNQNLFIKSITITGIFEKYSNKINFNRKIYDYRIMFEKNFNRIKVIMIND